MKNSRIALGLLVALFAFILISVIMQVDLPTSDPDEISNVELGQQLFGDESDPKFPDDPAYSPIILMLALVLIVGLLGGAFLAKEEDQQ